MSDIKSGTKIRYYDVFVTANPDEDDCLGAAEREYIAGNPGLVGYDLSPRWADDNDREVVILTVPDFGPTLT